MSSLPANSPWTAAAFVGGHPYLDFLNTGGGKTKARDAPPFQGWHEVLGWMEAAGLATPAELTWLLSLANGSDAAAALGRLAAQRESSYAVFSALAHDRAPPASDQARLEGDIRLALRHAGLRFRGHEAGWRIDEAAAGLELPRYRLALSAQSLITDGLLPALRECEACSWLFLDTSRGGRRRWCSMAACGNRAKARRHYHAQHTAA